MLLEFCWDCLLEMSGYPVGVIVGDWSHGPGQGNRELALLKWVLRSLPQATEPRNPLVISDVSFHLFPSALLYSLPTLRNY